MLQTDFLCPDGIRITLEQRLGFADALEVIWIPLSSVYTHCTSCYPALSWREPCFKQVCMTAEESERDISNEEEGC